MLVRRFFPFILLFAAVATPSFAKTGQTTQTDEQIKQAIIDGQNPVMVERIPWFMSQH